MVVDTGFGEIVGTDGGSAAVEGLAAVESAGEAVKAATKVRSDVPRFKYGNGNPFEVIEGEETSKPGPGLGGGVTGVMRWVVPVNDRREVRLELGLESGSGLGYRVRVRVRVRGNMRVATHVTGYSELSLLMHDSHFR